jgi:hypothetical protein
MTLGVVISKKSCSKIFRFIQSAGDFFCQAGKLFPEIFFANVMARLPCVRASSLSPGEKVKALKVGFRNFADNIFF